MRHVQLHPGLALQLWLSARQAAHVSAHAVAVPDAFADRISLAQHRKAAAYTVLEPNEGRHFDGVYTAGNWTYVMPYELGYDADTLFRRMQDTTVSIYWSPNPDSGAVDLHSVMTFLHDFDLAVGIGHAVGRQGGLA